MHKMNPNVNKDQDTIVNFLLEIMDCCLLLWPLLDLYSFLTFACWRNSQDACPASFESSGWGPESCPKVAAEA